MSESMDRERYENYMRARQLLEELGYVCVSRQHLIDLTDERDEYLAEIKALSKELNDRYYDATDWNLKPGYAAINLIERITTELASETKWAEEYHAQMQQAGDAIATLLNLYDMHILVAQPENAQVVGEAVQAAREAVGK